MPNRSTEQRHAERPACVYTIRVSPVHIKPNKLRVTLSFTHAELVFSLERLVSVSNLNRIRAACRRKGYTYRTEKTYLRWIVRYVKYHGTQHPRAFGKSEVRDYLSYLATERTVAASTQNQALNALLFLHRDVLGADWDEVSDFDRAREPDRLR